VQVLRVSLRPANDLLNGSNGADSNAGFLRLAHALQTEVRLKLSELRAFKQYALIDCQSVTSARNIRIGTCKHAVSLLFILLQAVVACGRRCG
jgi:hypothetical protein